MLLQNKILLLTQGHSPDVSKSNFISDAIYKKPSLILMDRSVALLFRLAVW